MNIPIWNRPLRISRSETRLLSLFLRLILSAGLLVCLYRIGTQALATWNAREDTPESLRRAIRWEPSNGRYHARLARSLQFSFEDVTVEEVVGHYQRAVELDPFRADAWADLGAAYEWAARIPEAQRAYQRAQELFPSSPAINWKLANFYLRSGDNLRAYAAMRRALRGSAELRRAAFDLAWRATGDADRILAEMIPPDAPLLFDYIAYLCETQRLDAAAAAWKRLLNDRLPFEPRASFGYLGMLMKYGRANELVAAWDALAGRFPAVIPARRPANLIINGDFEDAILNGGLDWQILQVEGVEAQVDALVAFSGARALRVSFDGSQNFEYFHVLQYVPVQPGTRYRLTADFYTPRSWPSAAARRGTGAWRLRAATHQTSECPTPGVLATLRTPARRPRHLGLSLSAAAGSLRAARRCGYPCHSLDTSHRETHNYPSPCTFMKSITRSNSGRSAADSNAMDDLQTNSLREAVPVEQRVQQIRQGFRQLERRDWTLWGSALIIILSLTGAVISFSMSVLSRPDEPFFQFHISQSVRGLVGLVLLFSVFAVHQEVRLKRMARQLAEQVEIAGEQQIRAEQFMKLAILDPLTSLHNRRFAEERLAAEIARSKRHGRALTVALLDLNDFKKINDQYGHAAGDQVLKEFAQQLTRAIRGSDLAARVGGDEFVVLLPECSPAQVQLVLERLRHLNIPWGGEEIPISFSAGWTDYQAGESAELLLQRADHALYADKRSHKGATAS